MKRTKLILLALIFPLISFQSCTDSAPASVPVNEEIKVYESFDEFEREIIVGKGKNKTYVINFWATWCKPCVAELPQIEALHDQFSSDELEIVLLSLDFENQIGSHLLPFIEEHKLRSTVSFLDAGKPNEWIDSVEPQWSGAIPFTLILDSTREKRWFFEGQLEEGTLVKVLSEEFKLEIQ